MPSKLCTLYLHFIPYHHWYKYGGRMNFSATWSGATKWQGIFAEFIPLMFSLVIIKSTVTSRNVQAINSSIWKWQLTKLIQWQVISLPAKFIGSHLYVNKGHNPVDGMSHWKYTWYLSNSVNISACWAQFYHHKCIFFNLWDETVVSPLGKSDTSWPIVPAPDDRWVSSRRWHEDQQGEETYAKNICPSANMFITNSIWPNVGSKQGRRGAKPATKHLNSDTAIMSV
jgi:hypothetical protein